MKALQASRLEPGTVVTVPYGRTGARRVATVVDTGPLTTWGRGMRPWNATPTTPLCVVRVDMGGRIGHRSFGNTLVELDGE